MEQQNNHEIQRGIAPSESMFKNLLDQCTKTSGLERFNIRRRLGGALHDRICFMTRGGAASPVMAALNELIGKNPESWRQLQETGLLSEAAHVMAIQYCGEGHQGDSTYDLVQMLSELINHDGVIIQTAHSELEIVMATCLERARTQEVISGLWEVSEGLTVEESEAQVAA